MRHDRDREGRGGQLDQSAGGLFGIGALRRNGGEPLGKAGLGGTFQNDEAPRKELAMVADPCGDAQQIIQGRGIGAGRHQG